MRSECTGITRCTLAALAAFGLFAGKIYADGTETLGVPSIDVVTEAEGIVTAGVGLFEQPGVMELAVPEDAEVRQVLLYWAGEFRVDDDDSLVINDIEVFGDLIGGPTYFYNAGGHVDVSSYRADITDLGLIVPGTNVLTLSGLDYDEATSGAGILVIYGDCGAQDEDAADDGGRRSGKRRGWWRGWGRHRHRNNDSNNTTPCSSIEVFDGADLAFYNFPEPRKHTVAQTFTFAAADADRVANLALFTGSVEADRPNEILLTIDGITVEIIDLLGDTAGVSWDAPTIEVDIPAGADNLTVEIVSTASANPLGASVLWVTAALNVPDAVVEDGGGSNHGGCKRPWWKNRKWWKPRHNRWVGGWHRHCRR